MKCKYCDSAEFRVETYDSWGGCSCSSGFGGFYIVCKSCKKTAMSGHNCLEDVVKWALKNGFDEGYCL